MNLLPTTTSGTLSLKTCQHCGGIHSGQCPRIKAIEYYQNGNVRRVEYHAPTDTVSIGGVSISPDPLQPLYKITSGSTWATSQDMQNISATMTGFCIME